MPNAAAVASTVSIYPPLPKLDVRAPDQQGPGFADLLDVNLDQPAKDAPAPDNSAHSARGDDAARAAPAKKSRDDKNDRDPADTSNDTPEQRAEAATSAGENKGKAANETTASAKPAEEPSGEASTTTDAAEKAAATENALEAEAAAATALAVEAVPAPPATAIPVAAEPVADSVETSDAEIAQIQAVTAAAVSKSTNIATGVVATAEVVPTDVPTDEQAAAAMASATAGPKAAKPSAMNTDQVTDDASVADTDADAAASSTDSELAANSADEFVKSIQPVHNGKAHHAEQAFDADTLAKPETGTDSPAPATQQQAAAGIAAAAPLSDGSQAVRASGRPSAAAEVTVPIAGLAIEIASRAKDGNNRFEIRLDPAELGRIDVRLDIDSKGNVTSRLLVERADTLDLLRRDFSALERALNDAGLKTGDNSLQFAMRDQGFTGSQRQNNEFTNVARVVVPSDADEAAGMPRYSLPRLGGVDIRV